MATLDGLSKPSNPFNPADDRIVSLQLHLDEDAAMGHDIEVGLW